VTIETIIAQVSATWTRYNQQLTIAALTIAALTLAIALWRSWSAAKRRSELEDWIGNVVTAMIMVLSAEGMFFLLTDRLRPPLPPVLAFAVCSGVEGLMIVLSMLAKKHNAKHQHPGKYGKAVWQIAFIGGSIVAFNSSSIIEFFLRLALPLGVAYLWWLKLTADNTKAPSKYTWRWSVANLLVRIGATEPGEKTVTEARQEQLRAQMVKLAYLYTTENRTRRQKQKLDKLRRLILQASAEDAAAVVKQLDLAYGIEDRIAAVTQRGAQHQLSGDEQKREIIQIVSSTPEQSTPNRINGHQIIDTIEDATPEERTNGYHHTIPIITPQRRAITSTAIAQRDAQIIQKNWDALLGLLDAGTLCRSTIERACTYDGDKVLRRQALRIEAIIRAASQLNEEIPVPDRIALATAAANSPTI
jgi:VanZ family protein